MFPEARLEGVKLFKSVIFKFKSLKNFYIWELSPGLVSDGRIKLAANEFLSHFLSLAGHHLSAASTSGWISGQQVARASSRDRPARPLRTIHRCLPIGRVALFDLIASTVRLDDHDDVNRAKVRLEGRHL